MKPLRGELPGDRLLSWQKIAVLCVILLCASCRPRERFTHVDAQNPMIMFDQKTAESCWAGPAESTSPAMGEFGEGELTPEESAELQGGRDPRTANPAHLPFCKDLK
jgi:hypothetical protein